MPPLSASPDRSHLSHHSHHSPHPDISTPPPAPRPPLHTTQLSLASFTSSTPSPTPRLASDLSSPDCIVCMDAPRSHTLPCGHANLCTPCHTHITSSAHPRCPTCRAALSRHPGLPPPPAARRATTSLHPSLRALPPPAARRSSLGAAVDVLVEETTSSAGGGARAGGSSTLTFHRRPLSTAAGGGRRGRLVLLLGAAGVPLPMLAVRLAREAAAEVVGEVEGEGGGGGGGAAAAAAAGGGGAARHVPLRFAYLYSGDSEMEDVVARIRAANPSLVMLCADEGKVSTFEELVKLDLALCGKFGRSAPRVWTLVRAEERGGVARSRGVEKRDVLNACHYLALGPNHMRSTFYVKMARCVKDVRKLHQSVANMVRLNAARRSGLVQTPAVVRHERQSLSTNLPSCLRPCVSGG